MKRLVYIHIYIYICTYIHTYKQTYIIYTYMGVRYEKIDIYIYIYIYTYIAIYMYIFIYSSSWSALSHYTQNLKFCTRIRVVPEACEFVALRGLLYHIHFIQNFKFQIFVPGFSLYLRLVNS